MRILAALAASAAVHALALAALGALGAWDPVVARVQHVELAPLSAGAWEANRTVASAQAAPPAPAPASAAPADDPRKEGVVVAVAASPERGPPKETRFLAERDNRVEHETRARDAGRSDNVLARPTPGKIAAPRPGDEGDAARSTPGRDAEPGEEVAAGDRASEADVREDLAPDADGTLTAARKARSGSPDPGTPDAGQRLAGRLPSNLLPTAGVLDLVAGGPREIDAPDVPEGEATLLNTRRYRYAGYFQRIVTAVRGKYDPVRAFDMRDPTRRIYGVPGDRKTTVWFSLHADGRLKELRLVTGCGLDFLDHEALRAVRDAAPFLNPPPGLAKDGEIVYGNLAFVHGPPRPDGRVSRTQSSLGL